MFVRPEIRSLKPYQAEGAIRGEKMDANETPYDLPPAIKESLWRKVRRVPFNRYPDPGADRLRAGIGRDLGVAADRVLVGNGSDELIQMIITAYGAPGMRAVFPTPTFSMYGLLAQAAGMAPVAVPLRTADLELDLGRLIKEVRSPKTLMTFLAYPNNPTGNCFSPGDMEAVLGAARGLVVVDEAYYEFSRRTFLGALGKNPRLIVLRTFSKAYGLAGLRVGYAVASREVIGNLKKVKLPYNVNLFSQAAAETVLDHKKFFTSRVEQILGERDRLLREMERMPGIKPFPTDANFVLFNAGAKAKVLHEQLRRKGILVRCLDGQPGLKGCLRVSVGKPAENDKFIKVLEKFSKTAKGERS